MPPEIAEVKRWVQKADHDRCMAELALTQNPPFTDIAAFHCQQAVEKLLKAYLVWRRQEFEKIHDLRVLTNQCSQHDASFGAIRDGVVPLTLFAVRFRYPGAVDPSVEEVRRALDVVEETWDFVLDRLPPEVRP